MHTFASGLHGNNGRGEPAPPISALRVLLVDDDEDDMLLAREALEGIDEFLIIVEWASTLEQALKLSNAEQFDVLVVDYHLGGEDGLALIRAVSRRQEIPPAMVMLTGQGGPEIAVEAIHSGASDYVIKRNLSTETMAHALHYALHERQKKIDEFDEQRRLEHDADYDVLTGALKRRAFMDRLLQEMSRAQRYPKSLAALVIDVDHFRTINDRFGHAGGDRALTVVGEILREITRSIDLVGRLGGEEFCVVAPETDEDGVRTLAERIRARVEDVDLKVPQGSISLTCSVGATLYRTDEDATFFLHRADEAVYDAKSAGRNRVVFRF